MSDFAHTMSGSHMVPNLRFAVVNGAAAGGDVTVVGIHPRDVLLYVVSIHTPDAAQVAIQANEQTGDFEITDVATIANDAGDTDNTGRVLIVAWLGVHPNA